MHKLDAGPLMEATGLGLRAVARRLGVDPALLCRPLTDRQADKYACRLGLHPLMVWGEAIYFRGVAELPELDDD